MTIYLLSRGLDQSGVSVPSVSVGAVGTAGASVEGPGALLQAKKMKTAKKFAKPQTTVLANCSPKFRILFAILNFQPPLQSYYIIIIVVLPKLCFIDH